MKLKIRSPYHNPRTIKNTLFYKHYNPEMNFAIEDPLQLSMHPEVREEGLSYAKYFCSNSPISEKAPDFLKKKLSIEKLFSEKIHLEKSFITSFQKNCLLYIFRSFLLSQKFYIPNSILRSFNTSDTSQIVYFPHDNLAKLASILENEDTNHLPVVYLPKLCAINGLIDLRILQKIKEKRPFFLIVEDHHTFGLEGINGFGKKRENTLIDLLITHIPESFGKMLTIISGEANIIDRLIEYSFPHISQFPLAPHLGMFAAILDVLEKIHDNRKNLNELTNSCLQLLPENTFIHKPLLTFHLESNEERILLTKSLVNNGFLLPASSFNTNSNILTLYIHHLIKKTSIHTMEKIRGSIIKKAICESI